MGVCGRCNQLKVQAGDEIKCLRCDAPKPKESKRVNTLEDPGEEGLAKILSNSGISLPKGSKPEVVNKPTLPGVAEVVEAQTSFNKAMSLDHVSEALLHLKMVPVPTDLKQFKKIRKAIDLLESLGS